MSLQLYNFVGNKMNRRVASIFNMLGNVFNPMIPAFVIAGLSSGIATLLNQLLVIDECNKYIYAIYVLLLLVNKSFTILMPAFVGFYTSKEAGAPTPLLGAMLGFSTGLGEIDLISEIIGASMYLTSGVGGVVAAFVGSFLIAKVESWIHQKMPHSLDIVFTPLLSYFLILLPFIFVVMPVAGAVSNALCFIIEKLSTIESVILRSLSGFICGFLFLPINVCGLQHGIIALYPIELEKVGFITLYPVFAMAGASQVGVGFAIYLLSKKAGNRELSQISASALVPGMLGVATPLIYGVTLPYPRAFLASCIGAGIGGSLMISAGIVSSGWGPSGLLAIPMMIRPGGTVLLSMLMYLTIWVISVFSGFIFACIFVKKNSLAKQGI